MTILPDMNELADRLFGTKRAETTKVSSNSETITLYGVATSDSEDGMVSVDMTDAVYLVDDENELIENDASTSIQMPTHVDVREGDEVAITLVGNSTAKAPVVSGVVGGGDRQQAEIDAAADAASAASTAASAAQQKADKAAQDIAQAEQEIADFKANTYTKAQTDKKVQDLDDEISTELTTNYYNKTQIDTTYATKTLVSQTKEEIELSASQTYATKGESQPNLSPFFSHDLTDIYNATTNPDGYWVSEVAKSAQLGDVGTQLDDGWMHYELDNSDKSATAYVYFNIRPIASLKPATAYTMLIELRNMVTDAPYTASFRITSQPDTSTAISQTVNTNGYDDIYLARGGTICKALVTKPDMSAANRLCSQYLSIAAGFKASFDIRLSLYETASPEILLDTNAPTLEKVESQWNRYFSDSSVTQIAATYGEIPSPPEELGTGARYGATLDFDGTRSSTGKGIIFYNSPTSGDDRAQFMESGKQYQATWWARRASGSGYCKMGFNSASWMSQPTSNTALGLTSEWRLYTASLRPQDLAHARVTFYATFATNTAGKVEMCGFSLREMDATFKPYVTGQDDLSKTYATKAALAITDDSIRSDVSATYATKGIGNPSTSPWTAHDLDDVYNATTNPDGYWSAKPNSTTMLSDGWCHVVLSNAPYSGAMYKYFTVRAGNGEVVPSTVMVEVRNLETDTTGVVGDRVTIGGINRQLATISERTITEDGTYYFEVGVNDESLGNFATVRPGVSAGKTAELDIRISTYAQAERDDGTLIPYRGPYKPYVTDQQSLGKTYTKSSTFVQTVDGLDGRITTTEDGLAVQQTLIRQYAGGVLVAYTGNTVGALVNAAGQYDIVALTWQDGEPTVGTTLSTFTATDLLLGLQAENALISLLGGTGSISASTDWTDGEYGMTVRGPGALAMHTGSSRAVGISMEKAWERRVIDPTQPPTTADSTELFIDAPRPSISYGSDYYFEFVKHLWDETSREYTIAGDSVKLTVPDAGVLGMTGLQVGGGIDGGSQLPSGTSARGIFFGTTVVSFSGTTKQIWTSAQFATQFGRAPKLGDQVIFTSGDAGASAGLLVSSEMNLSGGATVTGVTARLSGSKSGAVRLNYLVILAA